MSNMKYGYRTGPFYRKFMVGNMGIEVNEDGKGGLWLHIWDCTSAGGRLSLPASQRPAFHFDSEDQFMEFCTKLLGVDHNSFEEFWLRWG